MRRVEPWENYWMDIAWKVTERSKDPSTQVGCVLVNEDQNVVSTGYNGFPPGFDDTPELWNDRAVKYDHVIHAEANAIARAAKSGRITEGSTAYVTHHPCLQCAKTLIAAGVKTVYYDKILRNWDIDHQKASHLMEESGVDVREI